MNELLWKIGASSAILAVVTASIWIIRRYRDKPYGAISHLIAHNRRVFFGMGTVLSVTGAVFYSFIAQWLIPHYQLPRILYVLLALAFVGQLLVAWVPLTESRAARIWNWHFVGGLIVCTAMLGLLWSFVAFAASDRYPALVGLLGAILASTVFIPMLLLIWRRHRGAILAEVLYVGVFFTTILILSWL